MDDDSGNQTLRSLMSELGWSPRTLTRRINRIFGAGTVADTAAYHWRDAGRVPRQPLPALIAWLLSRELGRTITVDDLWQGKAGAAPAVVPATADFDATPSRTGTMRVLEDWVASGLLDRRMFLAVSGAALTTLAAGLTAEPGRWAAAVAGKKADQPLLDQIEGSIPHLQRLDDANGGGAHLGYVGAQFKAIALLLQQGSHDTRTEQRLFAALADVGQLAGWMAFDAGDHGLAQRYFFSGLRAARESGYQTMAAHILADLAFQMATCEQPKDAIELGEAAVDAARGSASGVRASVHSRLAYGYAVAGQLREFDDTSSKAATILSSSAGAPEPDWMYYLTPNHLDAQAGYALIHASTLADDEQRRLLARKGQALLIQGAHERPLGGPTERRALFEGAWLAVAAAQTGDLERACATGRTAIARTKAVNSARSMAVLEQLATRLRRATRNEYVRDFLPDLDHVLSLRSGL